MRILELIIPLLGVVALFVLVIVGQRAVSIYISRLGSTREYTAPVREIIIAGKKYTNAFGMSKMGPELFLYSMVKNNLGTSYKLLKATGFKEVEFIKDTETKYAGAKPVNQDVLVSADLKDNMVQAFKTAAAQRSDVNSAYVLSALLANADLTVMREKYQLPLPEDISAKMQELDFTLLAKQEKRVPLKERVKATFW